MSNSARWAIRAAAMSRPVARDRWKWCRDDRSVVVAPLLTIDVRMIGGSGAGASYPAFWNHFR